MQARRTLRGLINQYLRPYIKAGIDLDLENVDKQIARGVISLKDILLDECVLNEKLGTTSSLTCRHASIKMLTVVVPYDFETEEIEITVEGLLILANF